MVGSKAGRVTAKDATVVEELAAIPEESERDEEKAASITMNTYN